MDSLGTTTESIAGPTQRVFRYIAATCYIAALPTELLVLILALVVGGGSVSKDFSYNHWLHPNAAIVQCRRLWTLSNVCSQWRNILLSRGELWTTLNLKNTEFVERALTSHQQSRSMTSRLLDLRGLMHTMDHTGEPIAASQAFNSLKGYLSKVATIALWLHSDEALNVLLQVIHDGVLSTTPQQPLTSLTHMHLIALEPSSPITWQNLQVSFPALTNLRLRNICMSYGGTSRSPTFPSLLRVQVQFDHFTVAAVPCLLAVASQAPRLRAIGFYCASRPKLVGGHIQWSKPKRLRLTHLAFHNIGADVATELSEVFLTPSLRIVQFYYDDISDFKTLMSTAWTGRSRILTRSCICPRDPYLEACITPAGFAATNVEPVPVEDASAGCNCPSFIFTRPFLLSQFPARDLTDILFLYMHRVWKIRLSLKTPPLEPNQTSQHDWVALSVQFPRLTHLQLDDATAGSPIMTEFFGLLAARPDFFPRLRELIVNFTSLKKGTAITKQLLAAYTPDWEAFRRGRPDLTKLELGKLPHAVRTHKKWRKWAKSYKRILKLRREESGLKFD